MFTVVDWRQRNLKQTRDFCFRRGKMQVLGILPAQRGINRRKTAVMNAFKTGFEFEPCPPPVERDPGGGTVDGDCDGNCGPGGSACDGDCAG